MPSFADAAAPLSGIVMPSAIKSVSIVPLGLRAPLGLAAGVAVPSGRARTRCEHRETAVVGGRDIPLTHAPGVVLLHAVANLPFYAEEANFSVRHVASRRTT